MKYIDNQISDWTIHNPFWSQPTYFFPLYTTDDFDIVNKFKALLEEYKKLKKLNTQCDKCEKFNLSEIDKNRLKHLESLLKDFI